MPAPLVVIPALITAGRLGYQAMSTLSHHKMCRMDFLPGESAAAETKIRQLPAKSDVRVADSVEAIINRNDFKAGS